MNEGTLEALTQRVARLEQAIRWWKTAGGFILVTLTLAALLGASGGRVPDEISARQFTVRGLDGQVTAALGTAANRTAFLGLYHGGKQRAKLALSPLNDTAGLVSPELSFYDENGMVRSVLGVGGDGKPHLDLLSQNGKLRAGLSMGAKDTPFLILYDKNDQPRASLAVAPDDSAGFVLLDAHGRSRASLELNPDSSSILRLQDADTKAQTVLQRGPSDDRGLILADKTGKVRAELALRPSDESPFLLLKHKDEKGGAALMMGPDDLPILGFFDRNGNVGAWFGYLTEPEQGRQEPTPSLIIIRRGGIGLWRAP